jgi:formylglycine-generating enzyme required for sulfatase activity
LLASGKGRHRFLRNDGGRIEKQKSKGGSHLCAANYCGRYRPAARHAQRVDISTSHQTACQPAKWVMTVES